ncbi:MAG TPA: NAD(P)/FAD-dependent oxidoreductase [Polyangia bacterium]|nr:NAD(P)/FAD-dependent oxidoreductase [Polyangia bacterium]
MDSIPARTDVVVIGGGPAGSMTAGLLARKGIAVVLLEKERHPRPNVGESLIPHVWPYLARLGVDEAVRQAGYIRKSGAVAFWNGGLRRLRFRDFGYTQPALHVERDHFDHLLLRRAAALGADVHEETSAVRVDGLETDECTVHYRRANGAASENGVLRARYVVDASGQAAVVARQLGLRQFDEGLRFSSFWGYYHGGHYLTYDGAVRPFAARRTDMPTTLITAIGDWGWIWHIVLREEVSVGIILPQARLHELRAADAEAREDRFRQFIAQTPLLGDVMRGAEFIPGSLRGIRDYAYRPTRLAIGRCYLVGDAAAFVDPINSVGVVFGMYAGALAAASIERSLANGTAEERCRALFENQYAARLALFRLLAVPHSEQYLSPAEIARARQVLAMSNPRERQLMLLQSTMTHRSQNLRPVLAQLGVTEVPEHSTLPLPDLSHLAPPAP